MQIRRTLLRGAAVLALAATTVGAATLAPAASAAPLDDLGAATTAYGTLNKPKVDNDNEVDADGGIGEIPIIGDVVGGFKDAPPEQIVSGAIQFAGAAAETIVPLIHGLIK